MNNFAFFYGFAILLLLCNKFQVLIKKRKVMIEGFSEWDSWIHLTNA